MVHNAKFLTSDHSLNIRECKNDPKWFIFSKLYLLVATIQMLSNEKIRPRGIGLQWFISEKQCTSLEAFTILHNIKFLYLFFHSDIVNDYQIIVGLISKIFEHLYTDRLTDRQTSYCFWEGL